MAARLTRQGNCPHCGAPIYAYRSIRKGHEPHVKYGCLCHVNRSRRREGDKA